MLDFNSAISEQDAHFCTKQITVISVFREPNLRMTQLSDGTFFIHHSTILP